MPASFDPYHKWLGIPPKDQPPHHYRLLGIELFEDDAEVIESAANRLMTYLHDVAAGDASGQSQKLLNEISAARICLLNSQRKSEYDRNLQSELRHRQASEGAPTETPRVAVTPSAEPGGPGVVPRRRTWIVVLAIGAACIVGAILGWGAYAFRGKGDGLTDQREPDRKPGNSRSAPVQPRNASLSIDWPATQRAGATLQVNGVNVEIPANAEIDVPLDAGPLGLRITRPGYVDILWESVVARGEQVRFSPVWEPIDSTVVAEGATAEKRLPAMKTDPSKARRAITGESHIKQKDTTPPEATAETVRDLPTHLDIPAFTVESGSVWTELLPIPGQTPTLSLRLAGGESVLDSAAFQLTRRGNTIAGRSWVVHYVDRQEKRTEIAEFNLEHEQFRFRWHPDCTLRQADQLRNLLLEFRTGQRATMLALRSAATVEPLSLTNSRGSGQIDVRIDTLPEISKLKLKLLRSAGTASFVKRFTNKTAGAGEVLVVDVGASDLNFPLEVQLSFQAPRAGARVVRIEYELRYQSRNEQQILTRGNISRDLAEAKRSVQQRSGIGDHQRDRLLSIVDYYTQLDGLSRGTSSLDLHFQVLLPIDASQVVLASSDKKQ